MNIKQQKISITTEGRGVYRIDENIQQICHQFGKWSGLCQIFIQHTSASLIISENADPDVCSDIERFTTNWIRDNDPMYTHTTEGVDDMSAHLRSVFTNIDLSVPVTSGQLQLGTWQGIYLWEHRYSRHQRNLLITLIGDFG